MNRDSMIGCILGTAVGDALGLPYEGLNRDRARRLLGVPDRHRFLFGRGMVSDDTEHTCFVAQALINSRLDPEQFSGLLARSLRWWVLTLPAGVGRATLQATLRLWLGRPPACSGVFSAGNGPAIRSAILGLVFSSDRAALKRFSRLSTQITHTDPKALRGALAIALAAAVSVGKARPSAIIYLEELRELLAEEGDDDLFLRVIAAADSAARNDPVDVFAHQNGSPEGGISGYMYHTVPCVLQTWFRYPDDYGTALREIISAGGDTDTTAAILGGIVGARVGLKGIPEDWVGRLAEWPRTVSWMENLGNALYSTARNELADPPLYFVPGILPRNVLFLATVLFHGLRRLGPPY